MVAGTDSIHHERGSTSHHRLTATADHTVSTNPNGHAP